MQLAQTSSASISARRPPIRKRFVVGDARWRGESARGDRSPIERIPRPQSSKEGQKCSVLRRFPLVLGRPCADRSITLGKGARERGGGFLQIWWESVRWLRRKRVKKFAKKAGGAQNLPPLLWQCSPLPLLQSALQSAPKCAERRRNKGKRQGKGRERQGKA